MNLYEGLGQALREFTLKDGHSRVDYLLFVDQKPVGTIEAKPAGTSLTEVELQSLLFTTGLPEHGGNLSVPAVIAAEIAGDLEAALAEFAEIATSLDRNSSDDS